MQHKAFSINVPLTDEKLARYKQLIAGLGDDQARLKDALTMCLKCVEAWWELPESTRKDGTNWRATVGSEKKNMQFSAVPLEVEHVKKLWDVTPWMDELQALDGMFDTIQVDVAKRNTEAVESWKQKVLGIIEREHFPNGDQKQASSACELLRLNEKHKVLSETEVKRLEKMVAPLLASVKEFQAAMADKTHPKLPYPKLEVAELRNAAFHLKWLCKEITLDREPITTDKARV